MKLVILFDQPLSYWRSGLAGFYGFDTDHWNQPNSSSLEIKIDNKTYTVLPTEDDLKTYIRIENIKPDKVIKQLRRLFEDIKCAMPNAIFEEEDKYDEPIL